MAEQKDAYVKDEATDETDAARNGRLADALRTIHARKAIVRIVREAGQWRIVYE